MLSQDFLISFGSCSTPGDAATCVFSDTRAGLIVGVLSIGTLFGALIGSSIADRFGRRYAFTIDGMFIIVVSSRRSIISRPD